MNRATAAALMLASIAVAACSTVVSAPTPTAAPGATLGAIDGESLVPIATFGPPPSPTAPDDATPITLESSLLAILPASISGIPVTESSDEAAAALNNELLGQLASAVDAAVAVDTGNANLAYAWVVRLRPDAFNDDVYQRWRDSYDEGACSAAGGVVGKAEAEIAKRTVYITSCVAGLRTYHVWLKNRGILISASALGDGKFGEALMGSLRDGGGG